MSHRRYHVGSVSGYPSLGVRSTLRKPITTWYIHDRYDMCLVKGVFDNEEVARRRCWYMNVEERQWEKAG